MDIDDDDLGAVSGMTSEDLHRELESLVVIREPHWPDWLTRQGVHYHSDRGLDAEMFTQACRALDRNEGGPRRYTKTTSSPARTKITDTQVIPTKVSRDIASPRSG
jgi:hypothetical protein